MRKFSSRMALVALVAGTFFGAAAALAGAVYHSVLLQLPHAVGPKV